MGVLAATVTTFVALMFVGYSGFALPEFRQNSKTNFYPLFWFLATAAATVLAFFGAEINVIFKVVVSAVDSPDDWSCVRLPLETHADKSGPITYEHTRFNHAREKNSKGIPDKNIVPFAGKPLIAWTIEAAKNSEYLDEVVVSTDCEKIAEISQQFGATIPFIRPSHLAADDTPGIAPSLACV